MYVLFTGEQLDFSHLDAFLQEQEIERWGRELIIQDVYNAICRYHFAAQQERDILIIQLESVLGAARKLADKLPKLDTRYYAQFHWAIHQTMPKRSRSGDVVREEVRAVLEQSLGRLAQPRVIRIFSKLAEWSKHLIEAADVGQNRRKWVFRYLPPKQPDELQSERLRAIQDLPGILEKVCAGAAEALVELKKSHRPTDPKVPLASELAKVWKAHTGDEPNLQRGDMG